MGNKKSNTGLFNSFPPAYVVTRLFFGSTITVAHRHSRTTKGRRALGGHELRGRVARVLHQCCGILVKPLPAFLGYLPFVFIFKFLLMAVVSHDLGQLSHPFPLSLLAAGYLPLL